MLISIAIGTAGVIVILTMGRIVKKNLNQDLNLIGGATILNLSFEGKKAGQDRISPFRWFLPSVADALRELPGVNRVTVTAKKTSMARVVLGNTVYQFPLMGTDEYFWEVTGHASATGSFYDGEAVKGRALVCVLGEKLARRFFGAETNPLGQQLRIDGSVFRVIGILSEDTSGDLANGAFIPLTALEDRFDGLPPTNRISVRCNSWDDVESVASAIPGTVARFQSVERLEVEVPRGALEQVKRIVFWVEAFIILAVSATLFLGGYGIWNGMMTAVKSRTREIGLKKAMGAADRDIMFQFLSEALCLSCSAGILGVAMGIVGVNMASTMLGSAPTRTVLLMYCIVAFAFSILLGAIAGYYPSLRASRMEVVSALRYE